MVFMAYFIEHSLCVDVSSEPNRFAAKPIHDIRWWSHDASPGQFVFDGLEYRVYNKDTWESEGFLRPKNQLAMLRLPAGRRLQAATVLGRNTYVTYVGHLEIVQVYLESKCPQAVQMLEWST